MILFSLLIVLFQVIELPLLNPELFMRVGIKPPKGVLLYGPPGTGKTLLARAVAATLETNFLKVVSSAIVDKYIGESARLVREMFAYAKEHEPCIIFMDEIVSWREKWKVEVGWSRGRGKEVWSLSFPKVFLICPPPFPSLLPRTPSEVDDSQKVLQQIEKSKEL